jgi:hypothetical protein
VTTIPNVELILFKTPFATAIEAAEAVLNSSDKEVFAIMYGLLDPNLRMDVECFEIDTNIEFSLEVTCTWVRVYYDPSGQRPALLPAFPPTTMDA